MQIIQGVTLHPQSVRGHLVVARSAVGFCAWAVWGWLFGVVRWLVLELQRFGTGGHGWCRTWVGPGASGGFLFCLFLF